MNIAMQQYFRLSPLPPDLILRSRILISFW
jgi:hypothetical protein